MKNYVVYDSNKNIQFDIVNLLDFARQRRLNVDSLRGVAAQRRFHHKGYFIKPKNSDRNLEQEYKDWNLKYIKKETGIVPKKQSGNKPDERIYFFNNIITIYKEYHIEKKLNCREIGDIFKTNKEVVRRKFNECGLDVSWYARIEGGKDHYKFRVMTDKAKEFLESFANNFDLHYNQLNKPVIDIAKEFDISVQTIHNYRRTYDIECQSKNISRPHRALEQWLDSIAVKYNSNTRKIIAPKEIDIFIPEHNLAIEINGVFWHSDERLHRNYHLDKYNLCKEKNVKLLQFWDLEIENNFDLVKSVIANNLGLSDRIYARNTTLRKLEYKDIRQFLADNHMQGERPTNINYGLFKDEQLVMVATFMKHKIYGYELSRLCSLKGHVIIGGAEKLLKRFVTDYKPEKLMSFCDKRLFTGKIYEKLGFEYIKDTSPNYWYCSYENKLESRQKYQKHKLEKLLSVFSEEKSEIENMRENGYFRVFDCGNKMYILSKQE